MAGRVLQGKRARGLRAPWSRSDRPVPRRVVQPLQTFLETEGSGGILLLLAAGAALVWANSPWSRTYEQVWHSTFTLQVGPWSISEDLREWVNEALMVLFFFVVGLEIKRELTTGELRDPRAAALPVVAAVGGMALPALIYLAINPTGEASRGWGIPMATDIAFALGVLSTVGRGLPGSLKLFLLAVAIVDDIGAIAVIAIFYSDQVTWGALGIAGLLLLAIVGLQRIHVRAIPVYVVLGIAVWVAAFESGVEPTIAGVALGLLTPAVPFQRPWAVSREAHRTADETVDRPVPPDADAHHWLRLAGLAREAVSPLARLEHLLHPWTSFVVVPVFALANAGVDLSGGAVTDAFGRRITIGVVAGLVVGKTVGIFLAARAATRLGLTRLPEGVRWPHVLGVSAVAGVGFTVSLFIVGLAFTDPASAEAAKVGVLAASVLAGAMGAALLSRAARPPGVPDVVGVSVEGRT